MDVPATPVVALPWVTAVLDSDGRIVATSDRWDDVAGANGADPAAVGAGASYLDVCDRSEDPAAGVVGAAIRRGLAGEAVDETVLYPCHSPGALRWCRCFVVADDEGRVVVMHRPAHDDMVEQFALRLGHLGLIELDEHAGLVFADRTWLDLRGVGPGADVGQAWWQAIPEPHVAALRSRIELLRRGEVERASVATHVRTEGGVRWGRWEMHAERDHAGRFVGVLAVLSVVEHPRMDLLEWARGDALTGLADRRELEAGLRQRLADAADEPGAVALLFLDLDGMKEVNDRHGHLVGDEVLQRVADRLRANTRPDDLVGRLGGDEFVVVVGEAEGAALEHLAGRIVDQLGADILVDRGQMLVKVGASVGVALSEPGDSPDSLLKRADAAMYVAKAAGGRRYVHAVGGTDHRFAAEHVLTAWRDGQLRVHYQPIVDVDSGAVVAVEALLRWQHPERGTLAVGEFYEGAMGAGLDGDLGWWAVDRAIRGLHDFDPSLELFINLSPNQMLNVARVSEIARRAGDGNRRRITLEMAEVAIERDLPSVRQAVTDLRAAGFGIAIDDFGAGYSSLSRLRELPTDVLKLDRVLVQHTGENDRSEQVLRAAVALGASLGARTIAEGVETSADLDMLVRAGNRFVQGWLLHGALPAEALAGVLD